MSAKKKRAKPVKPAKRTKAAKTVRRGAAAKAAKAPERKATKPPRAKKVVARAAAKAKTPKKPAKAAKAKATKTTAKVTRGGARKPEHAKAATVSRRDATGHLDPKYAADLHALSRESHESTEGAFVKGTRSPDRLAEELAEEFVEAATSGEDESEEALNKDVPEDTGGPFLVTSEGIEFAEGTDPSNPKGATREPFPKT
jgi:hypothetical protein